MKWLDRVKSAFSFGRVPDTHSLVDGIVLPQFGGPPRRGTAEFLGIFNTHPHLRAVVNKIADSVAQTVWITGARTKNGEAVRHNIQAQYRGDLGLNRGNWEKRAERRKTLRDAGQLTEYEDHPLLLMLDTPNDRMTGFNCLKLTQKWIDVRGEGFWLLKRNEKGMPEQYTPVPPHWITEVPTEGRNRFVLSHNAFQAEVPDTEMVWFRDPDIVDPYGRGRGAAEALVDELETDEFIAKHLKGYFFNNAIPGLLVSYEGASEPALRAMKEKWLGERLGPGRTNIPQFTAGKMNAVRIDTSFRDMQLHELRKGIRDFIRETYGVPPEVMGIIENSNRATIQAAFYLYALTVLMPRAEFMRREIQSKLCPMYDDRLVLDFESPVPQDETTKLTTLKNHPYAFNLNTFRKMAGEPPLPEFEKVFPPLAMPGQVSGGKPAEDDQDKLDKTDPPWVRSLRGR